MLSLEPRPELLQDIFLEANYFQSPESHVSCYHHYYYYYSNSKTTSSDDDKLKNLSAAAVHTQNLFEPNHKMLLEGSFKAIWFKVYVYKAAQKRKYIITKKIE